MCLGMKISKKQVLFSHTKSRIMDKLEGVIISISLLIAVIKSGGLQRDAFYHLSFA